MLALRVSVRIVLISALLFFASCSGNMLSKTSSSDANSGSDAVTYFAFDSSYLNKASQKVLDAKVKELKDSKGKITVEGHCDERGSESYNKLLGKRRANAVKRYLVKKGIKSSRIETVSYGESRPVDSDHDESAWSKNRRAVILN